jgi:hypothetical protein
MYVHIKAKQIGKKRLAKFRGRTKTNNTGTNKKNIADVRSCSKTASNPGGRTIKIAVATPKALTQRISIMILKKALTI